VESNIKTILTILVAIIFILGIISLLSKIIWFITVGLFIAVIYVLFGILLPKIKNKDNI